MKQTKIRFSTFPRTEHPPTFTNEVVSIFYSHEAEIGTVDREKGLISDEVLARLRPDLERIGFNVESSKLKSGKIKRPVFFGENGVADLQYEIDAFHPEWKCGFEVEAGRAWMGNAVYRDLIQALVMVDLDYLVLAVPNNYKHQASGKPTSSKDYDNTVAVADSIYGHSRIKMPYKLLLVGY